jgi:hypothetical protein
MGYKMGYKKICIFFGVACMLFFLVAQPTESAVLVRDALTGVGDAASKLAAFMRQLVR